MVVVFDHVGRVQVVDSFVEVVFAGVEELDHLVVLQVLAALQDAVGPLGEERVLAQHAFFLLDHFQVRHLVLLLVRLSGQLVLDDAVLEGEASAAGQVVLPVTLVGDDAVHQGALVVHLVGVSAREAVGLALRGEQVHAQLAEEQRARLAQTQPHQRVTVDVQLVGPGMRHLQDLLESLGLRIVFCLLLFEVVDLQTGFPSEFRILHDVFPVVLVHEIEV